jgi:hypothetical protein
VEHDHHRCERRDDLLSRRSPAQPLTFTAPVPSGGHIPAYSPPSLAEDEMAWLRRRITEVTDLFPVAA